MHKVWTIARHEYLVNLRRPGFIIMTALVPLLGALGLLVAAFFGGEASVFFEQTFAPDRGEIGVVDHTGVFSPILPVYRERYRLLTDEEAGRNAIREDRLDSLLVIGPDYMQTGRVTIYTKQGGFQAAALEDSSRSRRFFVDHLLRDSEDTSLRERLKDPIEPVLVNLGEEENAGDVLSTALGFIVPYFLGVFLIVTIFVSSGYLLQGVAEEKSSRVIEIVLSSVTARELLAGKVLGLGALGLTQVFIWLAAASALSGGALALLGIAIPLLTRPAVLLLSAVYYVLGYLVYAVLMASTGALGTTAQESQQLGGIFSFLAAIPLMMSGFLFTNPNMALARALSWFPLTAPTMMLMRLPLAGVPTVDIAGSIALLVITIPIVLWAGSKVFRMGLLMYGKRPSLKEIARALRAA